MNEKERKEKWALLTFQGLWDARYEVSDLGRIRNHSTGKVLKQLDHNGYLVVFIGDRDARRQVRVHRAVAFAFCPKSVMDTEVGHLNGDRKDNRAENLIWVTRHENEKHKKAHGTFRNDRAGHKKAVRITDQEVSNARLLFKEKGYSITSLAFAYGMHRSSMARILKGQRRAGKKSNA